MAITGVLIPARPVDQQKEIKEVITGAVGIFIDEDAFEAELNLFPGHIVAHELLLSAPGWKLGGANP